jgi:hypothetical protein
MELKNKRTEELAPCGVYCGACPSFSKTCNGCASDTKQLRKSKWSCKIRVCCYDTEKLDYCFDCEKYPCGTVEKKLFSAHAGDIRFRYRYELPEMWVQYKKLELDKFLFFQSEKWKCQDCGGRVRFYVYRCDKCGNSVFPETK